MRRFRIWLLRQLTRLLGGPVGDPGPLREFVYLDEVSVYSMLASRTGSIATEFTESETDFRHWSSSSGLGASFHGMRAQLGRKSKSGYSLGSQVVRKAVIQSSFKELYEFEKDDLAFKSPVSETMPKVKSVTDLAKYESRYAGGWLWDPSKVKRGDLLEVEVEIGTEPFLRMAAAITTFCDLAENNELLLSGSGRANLAQGRAVAQLLDSLLSELVPIRGRLVEYEAVLISKREVLIHRNLLVQLPSDVQRIPVFVVGVAQQNHFWKDIRQILFSESQYTMFCRLAKGGLAENWHPVKALDVFAGIIPDLDDQLREMNDAARLGILTAAEDTPTSKEQDRLRGERVIRNFVEMLAQHHEVEYTKEDVDDLVHQTPYHDGWLDSVDARRSVFATLTHQFDEKWNVSTSGDDGYSVRQAAFEQSDSEEQISSQTQVVGSEEASPNCQSERFLDVEIVAIYW